MNAQHQPRVILLGPRGSGKTAVGELLARRLGVSFLDLDGEIERKAGISIAEIFDGLGEGTFREMESDALRAALRSDAGVIATGGGVVLREPNRELLRSDRAMRVLLGADPAILWHRVDADPRSRHSRPALTRMSGEQEIRHLLEVRMPFYLELATHQIDTTARSPAEVVEELMHIIAHNGLVHA